MVGDNVEGSMAQNGADILKELLNVRAPPAPEPTLPLPAAAYLGEQLRAFYAHLMSEPVPERFTRLLAQLDRDGSATDGE